MDIQTMLATLGLVKNMSDTAATRAETAQAAAETAAELAVENGYSITFSDGYEVLSEEE